MKELSVFVDESGDFGEYDYRAPYYIISMVFHDQGNLLDEDLRILAGLLFDYHHPFLHVQKALF
ncbi:MAG: hypothetical protein Q4E57_03090 [Eubacteriales bacterium]|nr:hypothetical protein [Eubacteriales bacterium]